VKDVGSGLTLVLLPAVGRFQRAKKCGRLGFNGSLEERMNERRIHQIFEISVLLKGAHALIECIGGLALTFVSTNTIRGLVNALTQEELIEDPNDFVAGHLLSLAQNFTVSTQRFYAFYLLSHGLIKVFLVVGLLKKKLWKANLRAALPPLPDSDPTRSLFPPFHSLTPNAAALSSWRHVIRCPRCTPFASFPRPAA
jgi:uncharacterized membrane protein (DUF2068 family)